MIDGYIKWLQTALGDKYNVASEEKTDYEDTKINQVILSEYTGENYKTCIFFTYQAMVLTNNVKDTMKELQEFTFMHNDERIATEEFPYVRNLMQQPVNVSNFQAARDEYVGTITISITLIASISINDIREITIDGEYLNPTQVQISYQAVTDTNRVNGQELNETDINEASLTLQITYPMDYSNFFNKARDIMFGELEKNTPFNVRLVYTDGKTYELIFKMASKAINYERSAVTTNSITLMH